MPIKKRETYAPLGYGTSRTSTFSDWKPYTLMPERPTIEESVSINHGYRDGRWTGGGPWNLTRDQTIYTLGSSSSNLVRGPVRIGTPTTSVANLAPYVHKTDEELFALGGQAISRTEPTNPSFSLSQSIGELRQEGLPKLPDVRMRAKADVARKSGSNYLNIEFGWMPLVSDIRGFAATVRDSNDILKKYHSESGKGQRRQYSFPSSYEKQVDMRSFSYSPAITALGVAQGMQIQTKSQRIWFSARYVYHIPAGRDQYAKLERMGSDARKLLGAELSPEVLWDLTPWTWAMDYFGTTGDLMHNISALGRDGLVMSYGFIMCHTRKETWREAQNSAGRMTSLRIEEYKSRRKASPYGFGVDPDGLSSKQIAVLAALGLSRV